LNLTIGIILDGMIWDIYMPRFRKSTVNQLIKAVSYRSWLEEIRSSL